MSEFQTREDYGNLLHRIIPIVLAKGLKATTMDTVAASLGMSKRTLYERFGSKTEMIKQVLEAIESANRDFIAKAFAETDNVMEALVAIFKRNRDFVGSINVDFYRDMDRLYKDRREDYDKARERRHERLMQLYMKGVEQGMFRPDVDFGIQSRVIGLQMEALKRIEELFPPGITLQRVFDSITMGFLRSVASEKGMKILDDLTGKLIKNTDI